jgi:tetratricopeptide (TPR) repeat protein
MASGESLFSLIQTLSTSEKRSFTLNNNLQKKNKKDPNYKEVFSVLGKLGAYDKEEILFKLGEEMTKEKLKHAEEYLYKKLVATLKISYTKKSVNVQLQDLILEAQVLDERGLHQKAIDIFKRSEKLALEYHKNTFLLEIIPKKAAAIIALEKNNIKEQIDAAYQTAHNAVTILKEEMTYRHENVKVTTMFRTNNNGVKTNENLLEEITNIYQETLNKGFPVTGSFFSKYYYHNILALSSRLLKEHDLAVKHQKEAIEVWEQHPHIINKDVSSYMLQLANQINYLISVKEYDEAEVIIKKLANLKTSNSDEKGEQFQNVYFYQQRIYLNQKKYEANKDLLEEIEAGLKKYKGKINVSRELAFLYNIGLSFWLSNDFEKALDWLGKIPGSNRFNEHRPDIVRNVHLLQLAIFYELNSNKVVEKITNKLRSIKQKEVTVFEETVVDFFSKLNNCLRSSKEEQTIFVEFQKALKIVEKKQIMGYEAYCDWVNRHIETGIKKDKFAVGS